MRKLRWALAGVLALGVTAPLWAQSGSLFNGQPRQLYSGQQAFAPQRPGAAESKLFASVGRQLDNLVDALLSPLKGGNKGASSPDFPVPKFTEFQAPASALTGPDYLKPFQYAGPEIRYTK